MATKLGTDYLNQVKTKKKKKALTTINYKQNKFIVVIFRCIKHYFRISRYKKKRKN